MSKQKPEVGVVLCTCSDTRYGKQDIERISARLGEAVLIEPCFCDDARLAALASTIRARKLAKVLVAGCSPLREGERLAALARKAALTPSAVQGVDLGPASRSKSKAVKTVQVIEKAARALALQPRFETRRYPLDSAVLVVGAGPAGLQTAAALRSLGHPVTLVDRGGESGHAIPPREADLHGAALLAGSRVLRIDGQVGSFSAAVVSPQGEKRISCGAVVLAAGVAQPGAPGAPPPRAPPPPLAPPPLLSMGAPSFPWASWSRPPPA